MKLSFLLIAIMVVIGVLHLILGVLLVGSISRGLGLVQFVVGVLTMGNLLAVWIVMGGEFTCWRAAIGVLLTLYLVSIDNMLSYRSGVGDIAVFLLIETTVIAIPLFLIRCFGARVLRTDREHTRFEFGSLQFLDKWVRTNPSASRHEKWWLAAGCIVLMLAVFLLSRLIPNDTKLRLREYMTWGTVAMFAVFAVVLPALLWVGLGNGNRWIKLVLLATVFLVVTLEIAFFLRIEWEFAVVIAGIPELCCLLSAYFLSFCGYRFGCGP